MFIERSHLSSDDSLIVLIDGYSLDKTIDLFIVREELHLAFLVEYSLSSVRTELLELVFANE